MLIHYHLYFTLLKGKYRHQLIFLTVKYKSGTSILGGFVMHLEHRTLHKESNNRDATQISVKLIVFQHVDNVYNKIVSELFKQKTFLSYI